MSVIFEKTYTRSINVLIERFSKPEMRGANVEVWLFDDQPSRFAAETKLREAGIDARLRSAYKPLLHFFLEEVDGTALKAATIRYPRHDNCVENRFLLETYPLTALLPEAKISFSASGKDDFFYEVDLTFADGRTENHRVFAPNRVHEDFIGETLVSPTGWLIVEHEGSVENARFETAYEQLFHDTISTIATHDWGRGEPYFEELNISVNMPITDRRLAYDEEALSLTEALHEDIYFSLLEVFQKKSGRPVGDRGLQPGQIVPEVRFRDAEPTVKVETRPLATSDALTAEQVLENAQAPLSADQIRREIAKLGGAPFEAKTRAGRSVRATYVSGSDLPMMISAGQHANETTGIVGALRAASRLSARDGAHFTISPQENPDGYEIHKRLCVLQPHHMHHASRYTALGDDLEYRSGEGLFEKAIRVEAEARTNAKLHVNLHGYPSHEWTRPLSGYVPRSFAMWTLPKGFFLIIRHHASWEKEAEQLMDHVTRHLGAIDGLLDYNDAQIKLFEQHAGETGFRIINGFPCMVGVDDRHTVPLTLITEYPDETIYGDAFVKGHTAQMETVLSAYEALQLLFPNEPIA
ncbi:peptidase M14 [Brucella pseudogrignonensis]|uniref:peptidase M14 n=1 Tax=Brucella pseudogrignonensis TaxID=419475 RepID=UPI000CFD2D83|nr:peptidase M14 [Brucella pseudogrignonensis]MBK0021837.1 peptidase M14 [Ochrobactrum sp. S45]MBK0043851.1 peptidase M14 [Ochrobactrum sp. S46]MQP40757.1 peptidase M14 [Ochrobactrum sp. MYb237]PQZ40722.1 peptidase M14 [Brucella pseudogrignonensis]PRA40558.1 peptidase M14 [Brucella pseudogrignonensis]